MPELLPAYYLCLSASPCPGSDFDWTSIDTSQLPSSYKTNSLKEKKLLHIADHFLQQYAHLCPDRKPLFLHPVNECGVEVWGGVGLGRSARDTRLPQCQMLGKDSSPSCPPPWPKGMGTRLLCPQHPEEARSTLGTLWLSKSTSALYHAHGGGAM